MFALHSIALWANFRFLQKINLMQQLSTFFYLLFLCLLLGTIACNTPTAAPVKKVDPVKIDSDITLLHHMQGRWMDVRNEESVIEVNGDKFWSIYQDDVMKIHRLEVFEDFPKYCTGNPSEKGMGYFVTIDQDGSSYCYQLISLEAGKMHYEALGPVGGNENL